MDKLISVIVPIYNVELYLDKCIESLVKQTFENIEIILVDDGSTDSSGEKCDKWQQKDSRIIVVHKKNGGLSDARNCGMKMAKGKYYMFVDSDDWVSDDFCQKAYDILISAAADIGVFGYTLFDEMNRKESPIICENNKYDNHTAMMKLLSGQIENYAWNKIYKSTLFDDIEYPIGMVWEDLGTTYKLFAKAERVVSMDCCLYFYRQRIGSITTNMSRTAIFDIFEHIYSQYNFCKEFYPDLLHFPEQRMVWQGLICFMKNYDNLKNLKRYEVIRKILLESKYTSLLDFQKRLLLLAYKISEEFFCLICRLRYKSC